MATHDLHTEIEIAASPEHVWAVLTDFAAYPHWNPFIKAIDGRLDVGAKLAVTIKPVGGRATHFAPRVLVTRPGRELCWLGRFALPGVFDGEHHFAIQPVAPGKVLFRQHEHFTGLLVALLRAGLEGGTRRGFEAMNLALKLRAERAQCATPVRAMT